MLLEMHCHTKEHSSCSQVGAVELVQRLLAKGLQGVVLTDHHYLWSADELKRLRCATKVPKHFLIFSGQEVKTPELGDVLVYGADQSLQAGTSLSQIRELFPAAALVWAHPYRKERLPEIEQLDSPLLDAIEIFNSNHSVRENSRGLQDWHRERFTAIAGTDTHGESYAGLYPTLFDHPIATVEELACEIRHGRCRPFFKEIPKTGAANGVTEVTFGTKGTDEVRERIIIRQPESPINWKSAQRAHFLLGELARHGFAGGRFRVPQPIDQDVGNRTLIQQGLRGKSLFDKLLFATPADGRYYLQLAARWLARLHNCRLAITPLTEFWEREEQRLSRYVERFRNIDHPHTGRAQAIMDVLLEQEGTLIAGGTNFFIQGHGDFHPKNIIIGQDQGDNSSTQFVAAIDFESSLQLPPAFDVGCFLAQFRNQFFEHPKILKAYPAELFLTTYLEAVCLPTDEFQRQVELFRARTNLSIAAFLVKVGKGKSADLWRVLLEAEQILSTYLGFKFATDAEHVLEEDKLLS
ncbi:phosphotransferase [Malonomonas rubra]|uniref:phosphotransferase n=1 Tax=Malonomonas rubra TaxID=57040 RepID=UPI0026EDAB6B|nr:phosphotransferase [Malonomonas rubra]